MCMYREYMGTLRYGISLQVCSLVRFGVEHKKRNSVSPSNQVLFCLLHTHLT